MELSIIVAVAHGGAIGRRGGLLCHLPADMRHFKAVTTGHTVIMGRRTYDSLPKGALSGDAQSGVFGRPCGSGAFV